MKRRCKNASAPATDRLQTHTGIVVTFRKLLLLVVVLRDEELVSTRREGKNIHYALTSPKALAVMHVLYEEFCVHGKE